jgi:positive regulator of sigma E activity
VQLFANPDQQEQLRMSIRTETPNDTGHYVGNPRRIGTETKASVKTSELVAYVAAVIGVLIASAVADEASDFGPKSAWFFITLLTIGYLVSRGLAKSGSRDFYRDDRR